MDPTEDSRRTRTGNLSGKGAKIVLDDIFINNTRIIGSYRNNVKLEWGYRWG